MIWDEERNRRFNTQWKKRWDETQGKKWSSVYGRMGMVFLSASVVAVLVFLADNSRSLPTDESGVSIVERNEPGKGKKTESYLAQIGEDEREVTLEINEQQYTKEQLVQVFAEAQKKLEALVLGENKSLDEVRSNLNLVNEIPETGILVSWEVDNYEVINILGELQEENLTDSGTIVELKALMRYGEEKEEYRFSAHIYPPVQSEEQRQVRMVQEEIGRLDEETVSEKALPLPGTIDGKTVVWTYPRNYRGAAVFFIGIVLMVFLYLYEQQREKEQKQKREQQLCRDYPQLISKFTLLLGAGMTVRKAWYRIVEDYQKKKAERGESAVYEEMERSIYEMQGGIPESECYERFGERCGIILYRKFGGLLSQNLKKGSKGLLPMLRQESDNAFEERKNRAKQLGEEAGTKLLLPMFLMLVVVLAIVVVPAFLSLQL